VFCAGISGIRKDKKCVIESLKSQNLKQKRGIEIQTHQETLLNPWYTQKTIPNFREQKKSREIIASNQIIKCCQSFVLCPKIFSFLELTSNCCILWATLSDKTIILNLNPHEIISLTTFLHLAPKLKIRDNISLIL